ncbi:phosphomannomutase/phosphoglucomutase [Candidatus Kuenenbacteria bacterium]|nr:phosphomannomutase/phosphoglucomutase [Candidatus Kuenenbacteria bacterium]
MNQIKINPNIFKKYDIRGTYPEELDDEIAYWIGQNFALYTKAKTIIVGYDCRISSPSLRDAVIKGITDQGANVIDIGLCSTSCFYFTLGESGLDAGIMVTASHAGKKFNGFKPMLKDSTPLSKEQVLDFKKVVLENQSPATKIKGKITKQDPIENYVNAVRKSIKEKIKPLKVVMDPGNGTAGLYIEKVFLGTGVSIVPIFFEPDGNFPNHETDAKIPENRKKLAKKIISEKADLGFMFDGDADRMAVLDRNGDLINYSLVAAIIAEYMVKNSSKKKVVHEVRTSKIVRQWVERIGGSVEISVCWTIPQKLKMKKDSEIIFGSETSGHYIFPEMHDSDDGILGALTFLQAISVKKESVDEIIKNFNDNYFVLGEQNFKINNLAEAKKILEKLKNKYLVERAQILEIDGLSAIFPDWWFNLRASETLPFIRLNLEADSKKLFEEKKEEVIHFIEKEIIEN